MTIDVSGQGDISRVARAELDISNSMGVAVAEVDAAVGLSIQPRVSTPSQSQSPTIGKTPGCPQKKLVVAPLNGSRRYRTPLV